MRFLVLVCTVNALAVNVLIISVIKPVAIVLILFISVVLFISIAVIKRVRVTDAAVTAIFVSEYTTARVPLSSTSSGGDSSILIID